ncbi:DUF1499 domain-containing protein [Oceanicoccus sp. KOV_DT_Chl]|uniref:DUF1499 domain-containing protein n=1 Tax=Oceanicoccus sp. KOV_DT_Chl TaxID=1904639 RepID=UPI000C7A1309|nr:DUF1499 domain-containing protein [Oceanicoccus sp. KOV_DT_Chl]
MTADTSKAATRIRSLALILLVLMPLSALGTRFGLWPFTIGLLLLSVSLLGSLIIQIINAIWLLRKPSAGTKSALRLASLFALPPLVLMATMMKGGEGSRAGIHDISTDLDNPPVFVAAVAERGSESNPLEFKAEVAAIQRTAFPDIDTLTTKQAPKQAFTKALAAAAALGWEVYAQDQQQGHIEAVDTTFWFGFKDDVVIRIQPAVDGSNIDLRSVSRVGRGDMGANANRIRAFNSQFNAL